MNSKILFSLLGLFYGMSRGAFRGVSFFCKFDMWTSFVKEHLSATISVRLLAKAKQAASG